MSEEEATYEEEEIQERRYGARVSPLSGHDVILVEQTSRLHPGTGNNRYTIDHHPDQRPNARHVRLDDDQAIRDALLGQL